MYACNSVSSFSLRKIHVIQCTLHFKPQGVDVMLFRLICKKAEVKFITGSYSVDM